MALEGGEINFIEILGELSKKLLELYPDAVLGNVQWNGAPDFDTTIIDPEIIAVPRFSDIGLTKEDITEVAYVIAILQTELTPRIDHFAKMKQLA